MFSVNSLQPDPAPGAETLKTGAGNKKVFAAQHCLVLRMLLLKLYNQYRNYRADYITLKFWLILQPNIVFRKILFTLAVEGEPFIRNLTGLDKAIAAFLYVCFVGNMEYPKVVYCSFCVTLMKFRIIVDMAGRVFWYTIATY